jgi:stage II sporulation protein D
MMNIKKDIRQKLLFIGIGILIVILMFIVEIVQKDLYFKGKGNESGSTEHQEEVQEEEEHTLWNVWIEEAEKDRIKVFYDNRYLELKADLGENVKARSIADITYKDGYAVSVKEKSEKIYGKILALHEDSIEIEGYGEIPTESSLRVFRTFGELKELDRNELLVGYEGAEFYVAKGSICGVLFNESYQPTFIRVLLKTNGFTDVYHQTIELSATSDYEISYGEQTEKHSAEEVTSITIDSPYFVEDRIKIKPLADVGEINIMSIERTSGTPSYLGAMEIERTPHGLLLINEVGLEEYLYSVIPSEMPTSYGMEALKAQAVCARSYAYRQLLENRCAQYGAHVDDSVQYQVYNNNKKDEKSIQAVNETKGQVAVFEGEVVETYYFSTSYGHTSTDEVWKNSKESLGYLQSVTLDEEKTPLEVGKEEVFSEIIKDKEFESFERSEPWYRWETTLSLSQITANLQEKLGKRYQINPENILMKDESGEFVSQEISSVGEVINVTVESRGEGGAVKALIIEGTDSTIKVFSEYNIRTFLAPGNSVIQKADGSEAKGLSLLPSSYIVIEAVKEGEALTGFSIIGGGNGHGVGMSQNGARSMAEQGMSGEEIIQFFFKDIKIENLYEMK